jgi:hypothetical protein
MTNHSTSLIGSTIYKIPDSMLRFLLASSLCLNALATDLVTLNNGNTFKGKVLGLADNTITLNSPHSTAPLQIIGDELRHIRFNNGDLTGNPTHSQLINLKNGDSLPGRITGLNDSTLSFDTWFAGPLEASRADVDSVFFSVTPQKAIFQGPKGIDSWEHENDWDYYNNSLRASKAGSIGREMNLPEDFILSTTFTWNSSPKLQVFVCSDKTSIDPELGSNNYLLTVNSSGLEVRRQLSKEVQGSRYHSLISSKLNLDSFKSGNKELTVELRINRREGIIHLYLDGEYIKQGIDPKTPPMGTCLIYKSSSSNSRDLSIKKIIVKEWDTVTQKLRRESRADKQSDTLATGDGDRFSGSVTGFEIIDGQGHFSVSSPLLSETLAVPTEHCAVLYFSEKDKVLSKRPPFKLATHSGGALSLSAVTLGDDTLSATHPSLGELNLDRRILSEITRHENTKVAPEKAEAPEEKKPSEPE